MRVLSVTTKPNDNVPPRPTFPTLHPPRLATSGNADADVVGPGGHTWNGRLDHVRLAASCVFSTARRSPEYLEFPLCHLSVVFVPPLHPSAVEGVYGHIPPQTWEGFVLPTFLLPPYIPLQLFSHDPGTPVYLARGAVRPTPASSPTAARIPL